MDMEGEDRRDRPLTRSGHARAPQWSPDGRYIAFLSDLPLPDDWIRTSDRRPGTAVADRRGFRRIVCSSRRSWTPMPSPGPPTDRRSFSPVHRRSSKSAEEAEKAQWKDVIRWREQERGDLLLALPGGNAIAAAQKNPPPHAAPCGRRCIATAGFGQDDRGESTMKSSEIAPDPKGAQIAFVTDSVSHRLEDPEHNEIYLVGSSGGEARRLTEQPGPRVGPALEPDGAALLSCGRRRRGARGTFRIDPGTVVCGRSRKREGEAAGRRFAGRSRTSP